jgi:type IV pilus assembly protein PilM
LFENIAAIDIGTSSVKVITVKTGLKDFQVKSFAYEDIDLNIEDPGEALNDALFRVLREEDITGMKTITTLPMERAIIRNVTFPFSDVEKIAEAIPYEAEENIPFNIDQMVLDFQSLKSENKEEGRILLAATHKEGMYEFIRILGEQKIRPVVMKLEANCLFQCYRYFNTIEDESVIQLHIGNSKTIVNIIRNNNLLYTRSLSIGISDIKKEISEILKLSPTETSQVFHHLSLDITSLENNMQKGAYRSLDITKPKLKKIYNAAVEVVDDLTEQINLTIKAFFINKGDLDFNRLLISGGGSNLAGIGTRISKGLGIPVVALPFLEEYKEQKLQTQFPIVFGAILSHLNKKSYSINFLKGEFLPDVDRSSRKVYYLSGMFLAATLIILLLNVIISTILTSKSNSQYDRIIAEKYKRYFKGKKVSENPLAEANKIIKKEKTELENIKLLVKHDVSVLDLLNDILLNFKGQENFELKNLVINERVIRFDGSAGTSNTIDDFKEKLIKSKKYDSVSLNIKLSRKNDVRFTMTIKQKIAKDKKKKGKLK